jgi:predicted transcriptional regulator
MPVLTIRLTDAELEAADRAAERRNLSRSEFARRALTAAAAPQSKTASIRGALKGKVTYKQAMKLLRG